MTDFNFKGMLHRVEAAQQLYSQVMQERAFIYGSMRNPLNQLVVFMEDPEEGDGAPIICAFPEFQLAFVSDFFELGDMTAPHGEYAPCYRKKDSSFLCYFEMGGEHE